MGVNGAAFVRYFWRAAEKRWTAFVAPLLGFLICFCIWHNFGAVRDRSRCFLDGRGHSVRGDQDERFQAGLVNFEIPAEKV